MELEQLLRLASLAGAAICMGFGAIGSAFGIGIASAKATAAMTRQPASQADVMRTMLIGMAIGESPAIFALVVAMLLIFVPVPHHGIAHVLGLIGVGASMGLGAFGPGIGEGFAAGKASEAVARNPKEAGLITRTMLIGQAVSESTAVYALVISLLLIYVVKG